MWSKTIEISEDVGTLPRLHWLKSAYVSTAVAGVGCFVLSFVVLGVWPNQVLEAEIAGTQPVGLQGLSRGEVRGRAIYGREGCVNCHSQFVRSTADDVRRASAW